jgi:hypothetical protein
LAGVLPTQLRARPLTEEIAHLKAAPGRGLPRHSLNRALARRAAPARAIRCKSCRMRFFRQ